MTFPATPLDVTVEAFIDGTWVDLTTEPVYGGERSDITISGRGRASEADQSQPGRATLQLNNRGGDWSPRNPTGPHYGKIGRNTPARVSIGTPHVGASNAATAVSTSQVAPSVNSPTAEAMLFCAWQHPNPAGSYSYPGGMTGVAAFSDSRATMGAARQAISASGATGTRTATAGVTDDYVAASVLLHGLSLTVQETVSDSDGVIVTGGGTQAGWWIVMLTAWAWDDPTEVVPGAPYDIDGGWVLLGDTGVFEVVDAEATFLRMKVWIKKLRTGGARDIVIGGPSESLSVMYVVSGVTDWSPRMHGEVPAWPQRWDTTGTDVWVDLEVVGLTRRLGQGSKSLRSALTRAVPKQAPDVVKAYWPMEDAGGRFASGLPGGTPMAVSAVGLEYAAQDGPPGSDVLPVWQENGSAYGSVSSTTWSQPWRVDWVFFMPTAPGVNREMISIFTTSDNAYRWVMQCSATDLEVKLEDDTGTSVHNNPFGSIPSDFYGSWKRCSLRARQSGSNIAYDASIVAMDGTVLATWSTTVSSRAVGKPTKVGLGPTSADERSLGHITVSRDTIAGQDPWGDAYNGYTGESAAVRIERLCDEQGVACTIVGDAQALASGVFPDAQMMGPQRPGKLLDLLQECADADGGILYEPREVLGVAYRTRRSLYNQAAGLTLDYPDGVFGSTPDPLDDDQATRNDIMVSRDGGSSYRATLEAGSMSTADPPDGVGLYDEQVTLNVDDDNDLDDLAGWRLHLGTVDLPRFPLNHVNLANPTVSADAALSAAVRGLDVGDRFDITNPPTWLGPDDIAQIAQGFIETLGNYAHDIKVNGTPERPWQVAVWNTDRWDSTASELASDFDAGSDTSMSVTISDGPLWTTDGAQFPFELECGGARLTCSAISGGSSPQTFTVSATVVNGVVKTIPAGTAVRLWKTPIWAL